jgi:hypothetical protein
LTEIKEPAAVTRTLRAMEYRAMTAAPGEAATPWVHDRAAWGLIVRYASALGALSLVWETAQLPLYTLWEDAALSVIAYAVVHCTLGDVAIGTSALVIALVLTRAKAADAWNLCAVLPLLVATGIGYTAWSEYVNTVVQADWAYSALMPVANMGGFRMGLAPLLQWLVLPPVAFWLARPAH